MNAAPPRRPPTYEEAVYTTEPGPIARLKRDWRAAKIVWMMIKFWVFKGRRIKRAWRQANAEGRRFMLDDNFKKML
jgi:hypothetical protein